MGSQDVDFDVRYWAYGPENSLGIRNLYMVRSSRSPAWSCMVKCTCADRKPGAPDCRGSSGQHSEEWVYVSYCTVKVFDVDGSVVPDQNAKPWRPPIELEDEDEYEDEEDDESPIDWPVSKIEPLRYELLKTALEIRIFTNISVGGKNGGRSIHPAYCVLHLPYPTESVDGIASGIAECPTLGGKMCFYQDLGTRFLTEEKWIDLLTHDDDEWEVVLDEDNRIIEAPFDRYEDRFWDWLVGSHLRLLQGHRDVRKKETT